MDEVKPKIPQRVADINAEIARQGNKGFSVAPSAPTYVPPTTISSSILQNDEKPLSIPTPTMGTSNADLNALLATSASQTKADALAEQTRLAQETAQTAADTSKSNLYDAFLKKIGVQQTKGAVQEQFGVAGKTQKVTDLTNQMEALDKAELDEIRNLGSQPGTLAQKAQREQDIRSNYNMRKADVAILQSAANRDLATASALAEAKINTQLEPLNTQIEFLSMFYEDNKEQLSKADQNAFNVAIQDAQAERTQKANELKILSDTKLEVLKNIYANASPEVANQLARSVQIATTPEQVMMAAGQFSGDVLERTLKNEQILTERAQRAKINTDTAKVITESIPATTKQETETVSTINDINNILSSDALDNTFGLMNVASRNVPGTAAYGLAAQINNLTNRLALAARGQLKGQGAVSDFEGRMLKEAQTALKLNMSPDQAQKELAKVRGALATSSGLKALVKITNPKTKESALVEVSQEGINQAIKDGNQVEYQ